MIGDPLANEDHIARYVRPTLVDEDGFPEGEAFTRRPGPEDGPDGGPSVHWLEVLGSKREEQIEGARERCRLRRRPSGRFAVLNVALVKERVAAHIQAVDVIHDPLEANGEYPEDESHSVIVNLPPSGSDLSQVIGDLIARTTIDMFPAVVP